ncbi:MAG: PhoH family protein [Candidatus Acidiferrales bacterium]|jgi:phosphate starvation-inducible protein PhoH and related proteins
MRHTVQVVGELSELFGTLDENLKLFESSFHVTIHPWNNNLEIEGDASHVRRAVNVLEEYNHRVREGRPLGRDEVKSVLHLAASDPDNEVREAFSPLRNHLSGKKTVIPKGPNQRLYMEALEAHDMVFATGPAGTGKTYLAVAKAVSALLSKQVSRIVLARPAVEAGERLGFLPGTLQEKVDPYMRPLYDALHDMLEADKLARFMEKGMIEVAPLAFMRGRTLNDSFVILDEAQNTTSEQMKMFLTRLGFHSKAVITGDITQIDLPNDKRSGMIEALEVVAKVEGIAMVQFNDRDVVRHTLVQRIIKAYEEHHRGDRHGESRPGGSNNHHRAPNRHGSAE